MSFVQGRGIDLGAPMTIDEFIDMATGQYGSDVIAELNFQLGKRRAP